jgi:hypothetical protein
MEHHHFSWENQRTKASMPAQRKFPIIGIQEANNETLDHSNI